MKKILVPIDFSTGSINALDYAIQIANVIEADVRIVHVMTNKSYPVFLIERFEGKVNETVLYECLDDLVREKESTYRVQGGKIDYKVRTGNVVKEIANQGKYDDATMIVVGTHGVSGFEDNWIGSNSYRLVSHSSRPVLTIRNEVKYSGLKRIILPIDITQGSRLKVPSATGLAKAFGSDVFVVGLRESNYEFIFNRVRTTCKQVQKYIENQIDREVVTDMLSGKGIVEKLIEYSKQNSGDLIVINLMHSSNPFDNLVNYSANHIVNYSSIPVLFIPTNE